MILSSYGKGCYMQGLHFCDLSFRCFYLENTQSDWHYKTNHQILTIKAYLNICNPIPHGKRILLFKLFIFQTRLQAPTQTTFHSVQTLLHIAKRLQSQLQIHPKERCFNSIKLIASHNLANFKQLNDHLL